MMATHPVNPALNPATRRPKEIGQTRAGPKGSLEWLDPLDDTWSKAHTKNYLWMDFTLTVLQSQPSSTTTSGESSSVRLVEKIHIVSQRNI